MLLLLVSFIIKVLIDRVFIYKKKYKSQSYRFFYEQIISQGI